MRLIPSALVVGTLAPDFQYFLTLGRHGAFGHKPLGALLLTLPLALVVLWLFHRFVKVPFALALPTSIEERLIPYLEKFRFSGLSRFALIVFSILLGIATHLVWDSFTHESMWLYRHWSFLRGKSDVPVLGLIRTCTLLQHCSTLVGMALLTVWFWRWYRAAPVSDRPPRNHLTATRKIAAITFVLGLAIIAGLYQGIAVAGIPNSRHSLESFAEKAVVISAALLWWQLLFIGVVFGKSISSRPQLRTQA
jgi:hypothetical protein